MIDLAELTRPVIGAPMAGGPSTPELAAAVSNAGGVGSLAAGYLAPDVFEAELVRARELADGRALAANLFVPARENVAEPGWETDARARAWRVEAYAQELVDTESITGPLGPEPIDREALGAVDALDDDGWEAKLAVLERHPVELVSLTFGCPARDALERLRAMGALVAITCTDEIESLRAIAQGADALIVQGSEAGGHRGTHRVAKRPNRRSTLELIERIAPLASGRPIIAAGGITTPEDVQSMLAAGAVAVQLGTALLLADEAGTNETHREALGSEAFTETGLTRAYSGRWARGLRTAFMDRHPDAPAAYPELNQLTAPLKAAAKARGDAESLHLWAGEGWRHCRAEPAATILDRMSPAPRVA